MGQVEAREAGEIAYMLANGHGKGRARRDGSMRRPSEWRLLVLSSGEVSLADKLVEIGRRSKAGQEVRLIDIPADAGTGLGLFEELHGASSPGAFAEELRQATEQFYGAPIRQFLEMLTECRALNPSGLDELLRDSRNEFVATNLADGASGQVRSVCSRFALAAAAGSLATIFGITGWPGAEADDCAAECFKAWLAKRGNAGDYDIETGIYQVMHGSSRFETVYEDIGEAKQGVDLNRDRPAVSTERVIDRVGFRRHKNGLWEFMIFPERWRTEVTKGCNSAALAKAMVERGLIIPDGDGRPDKLIRVPGHDRLRLYVLAPGKLASDRDAG
jgi:uncharacterized protein (DUF927 family)